MTKAGSLRHSGLAPQRILWGCGCRQKIGINPLNAELNPIRHLLALVGARHIVHVSRIRVKRIVRKLSVNLSGINLLYSRSK